MQTKMKILLPLFVLFMYVSASAQRSFYPAVVNNERFQDKETPFSLAIIPDKISPAFGLYVNNPEQKKIELRISHQDNGVVVDTVFISGQFNRRYNFEQAEDGHYVITLLSGKEKITRSVEINTVTTRNIVIR